MDRLYYLAGPHKGSLEEEAYRVETSLKLTAELLKQGIYVFSPLVYMSKLIEGLKFPSLEERRRIIINYLFNFLKISKGMIIITMEGWEESWGLRQELVFCYENQIPVYKLDPMDNALDLQRILSTLMSQEEIKNFLN